jgi:hypothetical protein
MTCCPSTPSTNRRALEQLAREEAAFRFCRRALRPDLHSAAPDTPCG